jgi:hypothetical protein
MSWFRRKPDPPPQPVSYEGMAAMGEAFARSFAAQIEGNAKIAQVFSGFISQMGDLSIRQAARALGQRSAATRTRNPKGKFLPKRRATGCELCDDPGTRNVNVQMILRHREHDRAQEIAPAAAAETDSAAALMPGVPTELGN